jgi:hypothetical protein
VTNQFVFASDPSLILEGATQPSDMFTFSINQPNGRLTATSIAYKIGVGAGMQVITPSGKFLYVETNHLLSTGFPGPAELVGYQVNADGTLTPIAQAPVQSPQQPAIITVSPNGDFPYISGVIYPSTPGGPSTNDISAYAIDQNCQPAVSRVLSQNSLGSTPQAAELRWFKAANCAVGPTGFS